MARRRRRRGRGRRKSLPARTTWTDVDRFRQYRGLLLHAGAVDLEPGMVLRGIPAFGRLKRFDGRCRWCRQPTDPERRQAWHGPCVVAYLCATVQQTRLRRYLRAGRTCPCGEPGRELDHRDALSVASASGGRKRWLQALTIDNLQWLCRACHAAKTGRDRKRLNRLRRSLAALPASA